MSNKNWRTEISIYEYGLNIRCLGDLRCCLESTFVDKNLLYINRLFVNKQCRGKGLASALMDRLIKELDSRKINCICEINAYGDLDASQLLTFYRKYGFNGTIDSGLYRAYKD